MANSERIEFDDSSWWTIRTYLSHGADKAVTKIARRQFKTVGDLTPEAIIAGDADITVDYAAIDWPEANDALVLNSTIEWSYGLVTAEVMETVRREHFEQVLARLNELIAVDSPLPRNGSSP